MQQITPVITFENVIFRRDWKVIIPSLNFVLSKGQGGIIRGPNGCGKTTVLKLCAGILQPTSGSIKLAKTFRYLGHLNGIKAQYTLTHLFKQVRGTSLEASARSLIQALDLEPYMVTPFSHLSRGLQRRVALVELLTPQVDAYLIDEPFDNLDFFSCHQINQLFADKIEQGACLLIAHHGPLPSSKVPFQEIFLSE